MCLSDGKKKSGVVVNDTANDLFYVGRSCHRLLTLNLCFQGILEFFELGSEVLEQLFFGIFFKNVVEEANARYELFCVFLCDCTQSHGLIY